MEKKAAHPFVRLFLCGIGSAHRIPHKRQIDAATVLCKVMCSQLQIFSSLDRVPDQCKINRKSGGGDHGRQYRKEQPIPPSVEIEVATRDHEEDEQQGDRSRDHAYRQEPP